jgi:hypothetical protein
MAPRIAALCAAPSPARAAFTAVRTAVRMARLRSRRRSFCRMRFIEDFVFATSTLL